MSYGLWARAMDRQWKEKAPGSREMLLPGALFERRMKSWNGMLFSQKVYLTAGDFTIKPIAQEFCLITHRRGSIIKIVEN